MAPLMLVARLNDGKLCGTCTIRNEPKWAIHHDGMNVLTLHSKAKTALGQPESQHGAIPVVSIPVANPFHLPLFIGRCDRSKQCPMPCLEI